MNYLYKQFGTIVAAAMKQEELPEDNYDWDALSSLFTRHNMAAILNAVIPKKGIGQGSAPNQQVIRKIYQETLQSVTVQVNQLHEIKELDALLEKHHIFHIFLKGYMTCKRYPERIFRSMGDIDLLYKPEQHKEFRETVLSNGYGGYEEGRKNDTYRKSEYILLEAHRQLVPSDSGFFQWCSGVWARSIQAEGSSYAFEMKLEDEFIFNLIHFAIHLLEGGAGARFLCDVYVYRQLDYDKNSVDQQLKNIGLLEFYNRISELLDFWFDGSRKETSQFDEMIDYIMEPGVFGSRINANALAVEKGKYNFLKSRFFPSYREMLSLYPWLHGKKLLLPFVWLKRGMSTFLHKRSSIQNSFFIAKNADKDKAKKIRRLYNEYGLDMTLRE